MQAERLRFFTVAEANDILPKVRTRVIEAVKKNEGTMSAKKAMDQFLELSLLEDFEKTRLRFEVEKEELETSLEELESLGCILKDLKTGLVDFPAKRFREKIWLCWKMGEPEVAHWHGWSEGYNCRKPIKGSEPIIR